VAAFVPDTNVLIAAALISHAHHGPARVEIEHRLGQGEEMILSSHSVVECYSVLTRMPPPGRFLPAAAWSAIEWNYVGRAKVVALKAQQILELVRSAPGRNIVGGRTYDAVIAAVADSSGAETLLTFNERHFAPLLGRARVVVPAGR
jgi:predicted nucleic acid-binding protein